MTPAYDNTKMRDKYGRGKTYSSAPHSPSRFVRAFPSLRFYIRLAKGPVQWLFRKGAACDDIAWVYASAWCGDELERTGGTIEIEGLDNVAELDEPCVFVANHMSVLETFFLPAIIRPILPVTFVVKQSLVSMPLFGPVMRSRDPVVVGRKNPREDLMAVLSGGAAKLANGVSIVVFPQHTRSRDFDPGQFNSIGEKLAARAGAPVVPVALKTDAWGLGKKIKELGRIRPDLPVRFAFGKPIKIIGKGKAERAQICEFIGDRVAKWKKEDGVNE